MMVIIYLLLPMRPYNAKYLSKHAEDELPPPSPHSTLTPVLPVPSIKQAPVPA